MVLKLIQHFRERIKQYPTAKKFLKFGIVGATSACVSIGVFWLISLQYPALNLLSKAIGYVMGFFVGFTLNKFWTYIEHTEEDEKYLLKYILVYGVTLIVFLFLNFIFDHLLHPNIWFADLAEKLELDQLAIFLFKNGPLVSNLLAIFINIFLNFIGTNKLVFKVPEPDHLFE